MVQRSLITFLDPPPATIGLIWQILYPIILISFGFVFMQAIRQNVPWRVAFPFGINLVSNLVFTPIESIMVERAGK